MCNSVCPYLVCPYFCMPMCFCMDDASLRLLRTFAGVLGEKICMRAILKENTANYISLEWEVARSDRPARLLTMETVMQCRLFIFLL